MRTRVFRSVFNAVYTLLVLKCYTWRFHRDVSWILYLGKMQNCQNYFQIVRPLNHSKFPNLGLVLLVYGVGPVFWVWTGLLPALTQKMDQHWITIHHHLQPSLKLTTSSVCASRVYQIERAVCSSLVCLSHTMGLSTVPACQMS